MAGEQTTPNPGGRVEPDAVGESTAALLETVADLHPGATVVRARDRGRTLAFRGAPNLTRPRLLVPGARRPAARALLRFSVALTARETISRLAAAAAIRTLGVGVVFPEGLAVDGGDGDDLGRHLCGELGEPVVYGLGVGTARANRKPVLEVLDSAGRTLAFAKVGDNPVARERVLAEAGALAEVQGRLGAGFDVPGVISLSRWRDHDVLLLTALRTVPQRPGGDRRIPIDRVREFGESFDSGRGCLAEVPQWARLRAATLPAGPLTDRWTALADRLQAAAGEGPELRITAWHGDWSPWNMAWRGPLLQLWDFERFEAGAVHGLDAFHYPVNAIMLRQGPSAAGVLAGMDAGLAALGDTPVARVTGAVYLAAVAFRHLESIGKNGEHLVTERIAVLLAALDSWLGAMVEARGERP